MLLLYELLFCFFQCFKYFLYSKSLDSLEECVVVIADDGVLSISSIEGLGGGVDFILLIINEVVEKRKKGQEKREEQSI